MIEICLDSKKFAQKPEVHETALVSTVIASKRKLISFDEFIKALASGQTYTPGLFKESIRKAKNWIGQQIFVADIDSDNISLAELQIKCNCFALQPAVIHESFSSTEDCKKWRVIFISNKLITDPADALSLLRAIKNHFKSDGAVVDLARLLYGTTPDKIRFTSETYFNINDIDLLSYHKEFVSEHPETSGNGLPSKSKNTFKSKAYLNIVEMSILHSNTSRYQRLWHGTRKLTQSGMFDALTIEKEIKRIVRKTKEFDDYDKNINEIILNAVHWGQTRIWD